MLFLLSILTLTNVILMKVTHRDQLPLMFCAPIFMTQAMVKTGKFNPLLTHLRYFHQILNCMAKVRTLRLPQTYVILIVQKKHLSQTRTLKQHTNLCNSHHRDQVTLLPIMKLPILFQKKCIRTNLATRGGKYTFCPNPNPIYSKLYR